MKKLLLILIVLGGGYYYFQGNEKQILTVSELLNNSGIKDQSIVEVTGKVESNFKLIYSIYELKDNLTGESIMVTSKTDLPKIGSTVTKSLKRTDVITMNDKTFSLFEEAD